MRTPTASKIVNQARAGGGWATDHVRSWRSPGFDRPVSQAATAVQIEHPRFRRWTETMNHRMMFHRKLWEWCYTLDALDRGRVMRPGARALGFGVGTEAIPAVLASTGVEVVATDQPADGAGLWAETNQHASSLAALVRDDICPRGTFDRLVTFRPVDMRAIPDDLRGFDAVWSSCCFEHLGSPQAGLDFVLASMDCLRPGGLAVHTTEFDVHPTDEVVELGDTVLYRRQELARLARLLRQRGHHLQCNFRLPAEHPHDRHEDSEPYGEVHMRVRLGSTAATSFGFIVRKREV